MNEVNRKKASERLRNPAGAIGPELEEQLYQIGLKKYNRAKNMIADAFGEDDDEDDGGIKAKEVVTI